MSKPIRKIIKKIHLYIGLALFLPFTLSGLTGSVLVFQDQLKNLSAAPETSKILTASRPIEEIIQAAQIESASGAIPIMYRAPEKTVAPAMVRLMNKQKTINIYVDPASLAIIKNNSEQGLLRQIFLLHSSLLLRDFGGKNIIGWFGVGMLIMSISGLIIWWPKKNYFRSSLIFSFKEKGFMFHRRLHKALGIWGFVILITSSFTGIYLAFPKQTGAVIATVFPARNLRGDDITVTEIKDQKPITVTHALNAANQAFPNAKLVAVILPNKDKPYRINFSPENYQKGQPLNSVFVNPYNGEIIEIFDQKNYSTGETIIAWQHSIHAAQGLGIIWKILVFTTGFLPLIFSITGIYMWNKKRQKPNKSASQ
jgi:uncharacterized iron-regulated membrane protein